MSKLYATIDSDARKTKATSRGHKYISVHAASWDGSVRVNLETREDGIHYTVDLVPWHGNGESRELASGIFGESQSIPEPCALLRKQAF